MKLKGGTIRVRDFKHTWVHVQEKFVVERTKFEAEVVLDNEFAGKKRAQAENPELVIVLGSKQIDNPPVQQVCFWVTVMVDMTCTW